MNPTTTILPLALAAAIAGAPVAAYEVKPPPEIYEAVRVSGEISDEIVMFGRRCYLAYSIGANIDESCRQYESAVFAAKDQHEKWTAWINEQQEKGATVFSGMPPDINEKMKASTEMMRSIGRIREY